MAAKNESVDGTTPASKLASSYGLSWTPVEPTGKGRGKVWEGVKDDQWKELYSTVKGLEKAEQGKLLDAYHVTMATLQKKAGVGPVKRSGNERSASKATEPKTQAQMLSMLDKQLKEKQAEVEAIEAQIKKLESVDEEMFDIIAKLQAM